MTKRRRASFDEVSARASLSALALFAGSGFEATSVQKVADGIGMSKQALMHHFPTKKSLRVAVYKHIATSLEGIVDDVDQIIEKDRHFARFLTRELLDLPNESRAWIQEHLIRDISINDFILTLTAKVFAESPPSLGDEKEAIVH